MNSNIHVLYVYRAVLKLALCKQICVLPYHDVVCVYSLIPRLSHSSLFIHVHVNCMYKTEGVGEAGGEASCCGCSQLKKQLVGVVMG